MAGEDKKNIICGEEYSDEKYQEYVIQAKKFIQDPNMKGVPYISAEEPNVIFKKIQLNKNGLNNRISSEEKIIYSGIRTAHQFITYREYPLLIIAPTQPETKFSNLQIKKIDDAYQKLPQELKSSTILETPKNPEVKNKTEMMLSMSHMSNKLVPKAFQDAMSETKALLKDSTAREEKATDEATLQATSPKK